MKIPKLMYALVLALSFWQCESEETPQPNENVATIDCAEANVCDLAKVNNSFGWDIFKELHEEAPTDNLFISPNSLSTALTMTLNGATTETFDAIQQTLQLTDWTLEKANTAYQALLPVLPNLDADVEMAIANAIYYREGYPVKEAFLETNNTFFYSPTEGLDFKNPAAVITINDWVSDQTNGLIPDIIDEIPDETVMYLLNAIYFKAPWRYAFDASLTENAPFYKEDQSTVQVPMMTFGEEVTIPYQINASYEAIDLPYANAAYSMTLLLPRPDVSVDALVNELAGANWNQIIEAFGEQTLSVYLPKFALEEKYDEAMKKALTDLGMGIAFDEIRADFANIGPGELYISKVIHKSFLEVSEAGTEAAAVTAVEVSLESLSPTITFDRPFIFVIRENQGNNILFMGKFMKP
ncbi:MAG: serpin family protein [Bacteroidota bacterium]